MSEVTFAKAYLATLDKRPIKLPADHATDPRKYPNQSPFILPRNTHPFPTRTGPTSTQSAKAVTITVTIKPMRAGETVALPDVTLDTSIHDLKWQYSQKTNQPLDKIKLLLAKKPAADLKTLKELGVDKDVELSVMLMGGATTTAGGSTTPTTSTPAVEKSQADTIPKGDPMDVDAKASAPESEKAQMEVEPTPEQAAAGILRTEEFWQDLRGFLAQRLRDQKEADRLGVFFRRAWSSASSGP